jgi:hypothetical protein
MSIGPTRFNPSRTLAATVLPGVMLVSFHGRSSWAEFEPLVRGMYAEPLLGHRYVVLNHVAPTSVSDIPDDEFRRGAARMIDEFRERIDGFAYLIDADGFLAATARAVVTGISAFSRAPFPIKTFKDGPAAADWLASLGAGSTSAATILATLERLSAEERPASQ